MKDHYYIKLDTSKPKVRLYPSEAIKVDMKSSGAKSALALDDYDFKVFRTQKEADRWLGKYLKILRSLNNKKICKSRDLPAILYKRRYMVQTLMREKMQTYRSYLKEDWRPGQYINLHDQVFFLTVRLTSIKKVGRGSYRYKFNLW